MNNVFAVGGQAVTLTANTNTPPSRFLSTPPSPTAVAINLLNLLKIANTMSHPLYNPFASGKPSSSQGQYGLASGQTERDPRKVLSHLGSGTSFGSSGMSSLTPGTSGGPVPSPLGMPVNYRPERGRITVDEEIERCLDLNISKAREEVRLQSLNQNAHFISNQRDQFPSSSTGMTSYLTSSVSQGHQPSSGNRSLDWLPICKRDTEDNTSKAHSSASSSFLGSSDGRFNTSSDGKRDVQSIPGLGDYDKPMPDKFVPPQESCRPKYTSESASNILLHFGLEKEDLEHLISYPEDQITPDSLPFILRQIRVDKEKRTSTAVQSQSYSEPQPITTVSGMDKLAPTSSRGTVLNQDEISSIVLKPSKVIDYRHIGKYTAGADNEIGRAVGSTAKVGGGGTPTDTYKNISHSREALPKSTTEFKSGSFVSSHGQMSSVTSFSKTRSSMAPPSSGPTKQLETQPNQTSQSTSASFSVLNKDLDLRHPSSAASKSLPLKQPEVDGQSACNLFRGVHPGRPGLVLIGSNDSQNRNRNLIQVSKASEQIKNLQGQQQMKQQPRQQTQPHQAQPPQQQHHMHQQPLQQVQQPLQPRNISGMKLGPPPSNIPVHLAQHKPIPNLMSIVPRMMVPPTKELFQAQMVLPKHLPIPSMMQDYAAATPTIFPHTCSLCIRECTTMEAWLIHQNSSLHLVNCRLLRTRYPDWDGDISKLQSAPNIDAKPLPSTSAEISLSHQQKSRLASPSRLHSPHRLHGSVDGRQKRSSRSRSRSPRRHHHGSEERRPKRSSRSPHRHYAPECRRERRSSRSRSPYSSQHPRRSHPRSLSPRNDRPTLSRYRSRSRSYERRPSPRRREDKRSSPRRSHEHRSSPRRSDDKRLSPRRSFERRSSADRSLPQRRRSRSAERLARRLMETPAVQSLSKKSDLEAMVKTLAPALLAELTKMKSPPSSASSSSTKSTKLKPSLQKSGTSSSTQSKSATASFGAKVRIKTNSGSLSQNDVTAAVEKFGKIKSVVLFRSSKEAIVCFEREEDADKLRAMTSFDVNRLPVSIIKEESTGPKKTQSTKEHKTSTTNEQKTSTTKEQKTSTTKEQKTSTTKEQKTSTTKEQKTPTAKEQKTPTAKEQKTPTTKEQKTPTTKEQKTPTTKEQKTPTTKEQKTPTTKEQKTPTTKEQKTPTTKEQKTPTAKEQKTPTTKEQKTPTTKEQKTPTTKEQKTPTAKEQKTPTTKEQKTAPQQKSAKSSVSTTQTTKSSSSAKVKTPSSSGDKNTTTGNVTKTNISVPKAKNVSTKQVAKTVKTANANGTRAAKSEEVIKETSVIPKSKSTEKRPEAGESKSKTAPTKSESNAKISAVAPSETAKTKEQSNTTVAEPIKKEKTVKEATNLASEVENSSTAQKPKMQLEQVAPPEAVKKEQVAETCAKDNNLTSKSATSANQPGAAEIKVQESTPAHKDTTIVDETKGTASEIKHLEECLRVDVKTEKVEDVEPVVHEETGETEPMEVESAVESKDQNLTETKRLPNNLSDSHPATTAVETSPCTPPPKPSTEAPQRVEEETSLKMSSQVQPSAIPHLGSAVEDHKTETETLEKQEQMENPTEVKPEDQVTGVKPQHEPAPELVSNISAGSPEVASSAKTEATDEAESHQQTATMALCVPDVTTSTVKEEMEKHQQQEEIGCVQTETVMSSTSAPPDLSNNGEQITPQESTSVSPLPATSAKSTPSNSVKVESADTDVKEAEKPKTDIVVDSTLSPKTSETEKEEQSSRTPVTSAEKQTIPAVDLPHINEDIFKAFTTVLREHKRTKDTRTKSKEKESTTISKTASINVKEENTQNTKEQDEDDSSDIFNEPDFNFEDFVTVDEISEDTEDTALHDSSSLSNPTSNEKKERRSSDVTPSSKRTTSETSKDCKRSTSTSSSSSTARSSKTSPSSSSKSVESRVSSGQKAHPSKTKTPNRASQTSSTGRSTRSSTTAVKTSVETHQSHRKKQKPTDSLVAAIGHEVTAESSAAKTVKSESKTKTSEMDPPAQGEKLEITHQTQILETEFRDETQKEVKTSKEKEMKMDEDDKNTEEEEDYANFQIIDSLDEQTDEQINEKDKDSIIETQTLGPEKDQILHQGCFQVSESADIDGKANPEASSEMEIDPSIQVQDKAANIQAVTADDENKGSIVMQESEDGTQVAHNTEESLVGGAAHKNQVFDQDTNQTPRSEGNGAKEKEIKAILSEELCRTSKEDDQISDEHKPLENDSKDTEQKTSANSADDKTTTKGEDEKKEAPNQETCQTDVGPSEEDDDVYQVIDSLEDQPTTETEPETNEKKQTKKGSTTTSRDDRPTRSSRSKSRTSKIEDKGKSPKKQSTTVKKHETSVKDSKTEKEEKIDKGNEEMVFEVVDSIEDDTVKEASTTKSSGRRQSARRHKEDEKMIKLIEGPDISNKKEEMVYKILDSVGEETSPEKPATRSTRGRKEKSEKSNENETTKKDKTPTRRRHTPSRDSHEKDKEKTSKANVNDPLKGSTPTKSDTVVRETSEEEVTYEILDAVEEEADDQPATQKSRRGRPKKDVKPTKKQTKASKGADLPCKVTEKDEAATYQILDSVEDEMVDDQATTNQTENTRKSALSAKDDGKTKKKTRSSKKKEEEEPVYQIVDSLEDDQEELMREVSSVQGEKSDTKDKKAAYVDSLPSGSSAVEAFKIAGVKDMDLLQGVKDKDLLQGVEDKDLLQGVEDKDLLQGLKDVPSAEGSQTGGKGSPPESDVKNQEESLTKSKRDAAKSEKAMQKSPKKKDTTASKNALVSLDEVSDEEEDFPDDTVEKKEIKKVQAASKEQENQQEEKTREKDTREQKSRSRSRGGSGKMEKKTKEVSKENEEKVESESQELVTLDEVGEDEAEVEGVRESPKCDRMLMEGELQELVTLDEIDEEDGREKPRTLEALSLSQDSQSGDSLKPEILSALDEAAHTDKKADEDTKKTSSSVKRKLDGNTEESEDFVTVDEVGTTEQEEEKPATRAQLKKRSRRTPVKDFTGETVDSKGHKEEEKESLPPASVDSSSTPDEHSSALSGDVKLKIQKMEMETETVSTEQQLKSESPDGQKLDGCEENKVEEEERSRVEVTAVDKRKQEFTEPEAKRPRSQSPSLPVDFKLPPFNPKNPLGQEFVVPKSGFFCNLCSIFYFKENVAKETHCSSQKHYNNLLKHYQNLQQKTSSPPTQSSQGSVPDGSA